ncbi:winged helix-turn-helix domain-containing protein [Georgenia sp. MJ170]|uniref:winged helix-turn-helix domain-containing protein n=1 Tax=Georgenia sunbinii TaxID=3117728 RepID=UPI002F26B852
MLRPAVARTLTPGQARRVAIAAQGLDRARPAPWRADLGHVTRAVERIGLLQIDSVNVLARAHLLPLYSRLGSYDTDLLRRATSAAPRRLVETWGHEACLVPVRTYPLLHGRRRNFGPEFLPGAQLAGTLDAVRHVVVEHGPVTAREVERVLAHHPPDRLDGWGWRWTAVKRTLELLLDDGELAVAHRTRQFERAYDVAERVLPPGVPRRHEGDDAVLELVRIAARAHGVATLRGLADYFRLGQAVTGTAVERLVAAGELVPVRVAGWPRPAWLHAGARLPRRTSARALLAPFDPLVFERRRLAELFGMEYRIGIYTPAAQRVHGYYVLPFLLGEHLVARVDLKHDRDAGTLRVRTAFAEPARDDDRWPGRSAVVAELVAELVTMAHWLGADAVVVDPDAPGELANPLRAQLGSA